MSCYSLSGVNFGNAFQGQEQSIFNDNIVGSSVGSTVPRRKLQKHDLRAEIQ